ncbi:MAG: outer membrane beta-barrel protein [Puia sp.]
MKIKYMKPGRLIYIPFKSVRRLCLLLFLSCTIAMTARSQVKFGLVGGVNRSNQLTNHESNYYMTGFETGTASEVNLSRHFYLFPELVLIKKGAASYTGNHQSFLYLNLPLLVGYRIQKHIEVLAGPTAGYLLSIFPHADHIADLMRKFDFGFCGTARFRVNARTGIDFSYLQSFTGIYKSKNIVDGNVYTNGFKIQSSKSDFSDVFLLFISLKFRESIDQMYARPPDDK